jgi:enoyl-CoA hydratase/3-hydroxyacyl-CoA dehydrogenase
MSYHSDCSVLVHVLLTDRVDICTVVPSNCAVQVRGVTDAGLKARPLKTVAVLGGGLMGSGICTALALAGYNVILKEIKQAFLDGGMQRIAANLASRVKKGSMSEKAKAETLMRISGTLTYEAFGSVDMVIEAALENIDLKQKIFVDLERVCKPDCILSSNTSTIDLNVIAEKTSAQRRIVGAHFFSPAHIMPLLEIVRTEHTMPQVRGSQK